MNRLNKVVSVTSRVVVLLSHLYSGFDLSGQSIEVFFAACGASLHTTELWVRSRWLHFNGGEMSEACIEPHLQEQNLGAEPLVVEIFGALHYGFSRNIVVLGC